MTGNRFGPLPRVGVAVLSTHTHGREISLPPKGLPQMVELSGELKLKSEQAKPHEPLIKATEAGELLRLHPRTVKRMALSGELPGMRIGRVWRFRMSDLDRWIAAQIHSNSHPRLESEERR